MKTGHASSSSPSSVTSKSYILSRNMGTVNINPWEPISLLKTNDADAGQAGRQAYEGYSAFSETRYLKLFSDIHTGAFTCYLQPGWVGMYILDHRQKFLEGNSSRMIAGTHCVTSSSCSRCLSDVRRTLLSSYIIWIGSLPACFFFTGSLELRARALHSHRCDLKPPSAESDTGDERFHRCRGF